MKEGERIENKKSKYWEEWNLDLGAGNILKKIQKMSRKDIEKDQE